MSSSASQYSAFAQNPCLCFERPFASTACNANSSGEVPSLTPILRQTFPVCVLAMSDLGSMLSTSLPRRSRSLPPMVSATLVPERKRGLNS